MFHPRIQAAKLRNALDGLFKRMLSSQLWVIDDWGVVSMSREVAEEVFDLMDRRRHSSPMVLTSNRDINEWAEVFPDPVLANATVDRIFDRAIIVPFQGKSYWKRLADSYNFGNLYFSPIPTTGGGIHGVI